MFNKKFLVAAMALASLAGAQGAFAARAHTLVMGSGDGGAVLNGGSLYTDGSDNMFYNPSVINDYKNWATVEKSNFPGTTAQGGMVTQLSNFNLGIYMNRGDGVAAYGGYAVNAGNNIAGAAGNNGYTNVDPQKPIEIFFGGDMGVKWGASIAYAHKYSGVANGDAQYATLSLGANVQGLEPFATYQFIGQDGAKDNTAGFWRFGTRYKWGEWVPYVAIVSAKNKQDNADLAAGVKGAENKEMTYGLGLGRNTKLGESAHLNYAISYWRVKDTTKANSSADEKSFTRHLLPINIAIDGDVASWLSLRAGIEYRLVDRLGGGRAAGDLSKDVTDNTTGRMGATIHASKATDVDFAFGSSSPGAPTEAAGTTDNQTFGLGSGFVVAASMTHRW